MEIEVEKREGSAPVVHLTVGPDDSLTTVADGFEIARNAGDDAPIWLHGATPERKAVLETAGYASNRTLLQMRTPLDRSETALPTRAFAESDAAAVVEVNNRAFDWHPEQSGKSVDWLIEAMAEPWFDANGFRLYEADGRLAGFCWTKIHPDGVGEIYVIALHPDYAGRGLGGPMTAAGLNWLADQGVEEAMLYVESDNDAAVRTYERLGFTTHRHDTLWRRTPDVAENAI